MSIKVGIFSLQPLSDSTGSPLRTRLLIQGMQELNVELSIISTGIPSEFLKAFDCYTITINPATRTELIHILEQIQIDILYVSTEGYIDVLYNVCQVVGCKCVVDLHGLSIVEIIELQGLKAFRRRLVQIRGALRRLLILRKVDALTVANPTLLPYSKMLNKQSKLIAGITDLEKFKPPSITNKGSKTSNIQVFYIGNFMKWQGCNLLLDAARILIEENLPYDFHFVGGSEQDKQQNIEKWQTLVNQGRLTFHGSVDFNEIHNYFEQADILVIPRPWMFSTYLAFPAKIPDYMASGTAILATNLKPHQYAIKDGDTGILCEPTPSGIVKGLLRLADKNFRDRLGYTARLFAEENFNQNRQSVEVLNFLKDVYNTND